MEMKVEKEVATKYLQSNTNWFIILLFNLFTCLFRETDHIQVMKYHLFLNQFCSIAQKPERLDISEVSFYSARGLCAERSSRWTSRHGQSNDEMEVPISATSGCLTRPTGKQSGRAGQSTGKQ